MTFAAHPTRPRTGWLHPGAAASAGPLLIGRGTLVAAGIVLAVLAVWGAGAAWYLLFRDEIAGRFIARQTEMQYAYEDKIGALRARLDRVASQKLLEQDSLETRVADLIARQVRLETRQTILQSLSDAAGGPATTGSLKLPAVAAPAVELPRGASAYAPAAPAAPVAPKPSPEPFSLRLRDPRPDPTPAGARPRQAVTEGLLSVPDRLAAVAVSLARIEGAQLQVLEGSLQAAQGQMSRLRMAVQDVGLDPDALQAAVPPKGGKADMSGKGDVSGKGDISGMGGPLVPLGVDPKGGPFETMAERLQASIAQVERLRRVVGTLPLARPVSGEPDLTSGFGYRVDPFTRGPALHTGLDFRAEQGTPVRATAAGRVASAESSGGYGNMVEVDHGNGLTTRYAHLSALAVTPGQAIAAGAVVGYAGSTGRSTGPHLHYETRVDGEAVDPQRFLRAGTRLFAGR